MTALQDPASAILVSTFIGAIGVLISSLEMVLHSHQFVRGGMFDWRVVQTDSPALLYGRWAPYWNAIADPLILRIVLVLRACAAVALLLPMPAVSRTGLLLVVVIATLLVHFRSPFGLDGGDQMSLIVFVTLLLQSLAPHDAAVTTACLWFLALQACLAYVTAGVAKLVSSAWRSGWAMVGIMNSESYGWRALSALQLDHPVVPRVLCWSVLLCECLFPLALLSEPTLWAFLAWGVVFHLATAMIMGLNCFTWAFIATYPAIVFCSSQVQRALP